MKIYETLSQTDINELMLGNAVGIFKTLITNSDVYVDEKSNLSTGYYLSQSGEKTISPFFEKIMGLDSSDYNDRLGRFIRAKYNDKWNKIYTTLQTTYTPLDETVDNRVISESISKDTTYGKQTDTTKNRDETTTYGRQTDTTKNRDDTTTYGRSTTITDNITDTLNKTKGIDEIKSFFKNETVTSTDERNVYGFNSTEPTPDSKTTSVNETVSDGGDNYEKITYGNGTDVDTKTVVGTKTETNTGTDKVKTTDTDNVTNSGTDKVKTTDTDNVTNSGTDTEMHTRDLTDKRNGRNRSGAELVSGEVDMRIKYIFYEIVYADIDNELALQIYM